MSDGHGVDELLLLEECEHELGLGDRRGGRLSTPALRLQELMREATFQICIADASALDEPRDDTADYARKYARDYTHDYARQHRRPFDWWHSQA